MSNPGDLQFKYLSQADLRRLEQLLFAPRRIIEGRFAGQYATRQRGQSVTFRDYRPYHPGDEVSRIDWKAFGRTDRLFIKLYEHQSELTVQLLVDASASMDYRGATVPLRERPDSKLDYACRLAAAIGFLIVRQHDRFAFAMTQRAGRRETSPLIHFLPAARTMRHLTNVLQVMQATTARGRSGLSEALQELSRRGGRRELLVIFSDLLEESDEVAEALAARVRFGGEVVLLHILHPEEVQLPDLERGVFIDSERGERIRLDIPEIRDAYAARMAEFLMGWEQRCAALGVDYFRVETSEPYPAALERYLLGRAGVRH